MSISALPKRVTAVCLTAFCLNLFVSAEIIRWDVSQLNLVTPPSLGDESNSGNTAIGVWFNMQSGEAYVIDDTAGIAGKTNLADGRFQLRWTTWWSPPSSDVLIQGEIFLNRIHGISVAQPNAAAGSPARLAAGVAVPVGAAFRAASFIEMAGSFGTWRELGRGFLAVAFPIGFGLHFGYVDITLLADGRIRLNGMAYNSVPNQTLVTEYIGAPAPEPAANLAVISTTATSVALSWEDRSSTESGFIIERSTADGPFERIVTTLPDSTSYLDEGLAAGTRFRYRVVATTGLDAEPSNTVEASTRSVDQPPLAPTSLRVLPLAANLLRLDWVRAADDAVGYRIERSYAGSAWEELVLTGPAATHYIDRDLLPGMLYQYRVTAFNGLNSPLAGPVEGRTFSVRETVGADALAAAWPQIDGTGVVVGLWDLAPARSSHAEFQRAAGASVINRSGGSGGSDPLSNHTTHGAGLIVARGADPLAMGVAPGAMVTVFDFENDQQQKRDSGMQWPSQPDRIQVAVSAYGPIRGWNPVSGSVGWVFKAPAAEDGFPQRDPLLGGYTDFSYEADTTAWQRPYLLQVRSSGNDRDDGPAANAFVYASLGDFQNQIVSIYNPSVHAPMDGALDAGHFIVSDAAAAKNTLTVGAWTGARRDTASGALLFAGEGTVFDNWGPTRDGRIKPDLVASGVAVYSAGYRADDDYSTLTGSSQAAPQVAAVAALLIQQWQQSAAHRHLRASSLKALLIHAADDLHLPGPDARTGWGLLNARAAVDILAAHLNNPAAGYLREGFYSGSEISIPIWIDADGDFKVTLAWTDPADAVGDPQSTTPRLREDLDLRVQLADGSTRMPYVLPYAIHPQADPAAAAVRADNRVDTVEQIHLPTAAGPATLRISRKSGSEPVLPFSLVMTGAHALESRVARPTRVVVEGDAVASIRGGGFQLGAAVTLIHASGVEISTFAIESGMNRLRFRYPPLPHDGDWWVHIVNTDGLRTALRWPVASPPTASYQAWLATHLSEQELDDPAIAWTGSDALDSGYPLLARYAFGAADPFAPITELKPQIEPVLHDGDWYYQITYVQRQQMDVQILVEAAQQLNGLWSALPASALLLITDLGDGLERVIWRDTVPLRADTSGRFLRVRVAYP